MIGCLGVSKQPIIALYFEFETVLKFYNLGASYPYQLDESIQNLRIARCYFSF